MRLHAAKNAAYRDAWKKRGEVIGVMANLARKVDRLEYVSVDAIATADESMADTAIDLLVYSVKYLTFLADRDTSIAEHLYGDTEVSPPYSDGTAGFDSLVTRIQFSTDGPLPSSLPAAVQGVAATFNQLEQCFVPGRPTPIERRFRLGQQLVRDAVKLVGMLVRHAPEQLVLAFHPYDQGRYQ